MFGVFKTLHGYAVDKKERTVLHMFSFRVLFQIGRVDAFVLLTHFGHIALVAVVK